MSRIDCAFSSEDEAEARARRRRTALFAALALVLIGASSPSMAAERTTRLSPFDKLELSVPAHYVIVNGGAPSVRIITSSDVLKKIAVEQYSDKVRIFVLDHIQAQELRIEVTTVGLKYLDLEGAGDVEAKGFDGPDFTLHIGGASNLTLTSLKVNKFKLDISGSGSVNVSGQALTQEVKMNGAAQYRATELISDKVKLRVEGASDVEVFARDRLDVAVSGASSVRYRGDPKVTEDIEGAASITKM
jgi:Putative auto-transporter adhesin, head GIN domain